MTSAQLSGDVGEALRLLVEVPVASFRVGQAREYWETYPVPPPSTIYGMLLSLVGEVDRRVHVGAWIAIGICGEPERSTVLRTLWRVKDRKVPPGVGKNKVPEFQELLSGVVLSVWIGGNGMGTAELPAASPPSLEERVGRALDAPGGIDRFGGLSLGESTFLVDVVRRWRDGDRSEGALLIRDREGDLSLPVWVDHVGSRGTAWEQFRLHEQRLPRVPPADAWVAIEPPPAG